MPLAAGSDAAFDALAGHGEDSGRASGSGVSLPGGRPPAARPSAEVPAIGRGLTASPVSPSHSILAKLAKGARQLMGTRAPVARGTAPGKMSAEPVRADLVDDELSFPPIPPAAYPTLGLVALMAVVFLLRRRLERVAGGGRWRALPAPAEGTTLAEADPFQGKNLLIERSPVSTGWVLVLFSVDKGKKIVARLRAGTVVRGGRIAGYPLGQVYRLDERNQWIVTQEKECLIFEVFPDLMNQAS